MIHDELKNAPPHNYIYTGIILFNCTTCSERPNYTHAFSLLDIPKFMKLAYSVFLGNLVKYFCFMVCFLKFLAFILSPSTSVNFIKVFQVIMHVLERMKPFVDGVITAAIRRKKDFCEVFAEFSIHRIHGAKLFQEMYWVP